MKAKDITKAILSSHIFWAIISFGLVVLFTRLTQYDYGWSWKTTILVISSVLFVLFGLGAVGLSIFNLIISLVRKVKKRNEYI